MRVMRTPVTRSSYFTPTEPAAVAALHSLFLGKIGRRALGWYLSISRVPQTVTLMVQTIGSQLGFLIVCNAILLLVGCFMELLAAMLILIPIMVPAAIGFGVDPVHFGVMMILNLILGTIHPPIGVVLFITSRIAGISFEKMSRAILPWLIPLLIVLAAVTLWPQLTLWLPNMVFGK